MKNSHKTSLTAKAGRVLMWLLFLIMVVILFFPFYWIVTSSFKDQSAIYAIPPQWFPLQPTFENYIFAFAESGALRYSLNSLFLAGTTMVLTIVISVCAVYPLTRMQFRGKGTFMALLASTQIFPMVVIIVPMYMMFQKVGLYNTHTSLIFTYTAMCIPIAIVLLMGHFRDLPREIEEAAIIDGCDRLQVLVRVILPISLPGIVSAGIYVFLTNWQEYLAAVSLLADRSKFTLTLGLAMFQTEHSTNWGALMATAVIIAVPAIVLFFAIEKYFIDSMVGSVKE